LNKGEKMKNLDEKISRFGVLCKRGASQGLTREENQEFKKLEKSISNAMLKNELLFDSHIESFKKASKPLIGFGFSL